ncbi:MAG: phosphate/phosphite/phosphonate ABC transporter substrate-binding protein [Rhodocyclaceae bacterium]|nr:phosphate/phosphite/phosphonate ABC transporter substrate-binding protein [Rhodocyclaceae bacterium]
MLRWRFLFLLLLAWAGFASAQTPAVLKMGVFPYLSPSQLIEQQEPLRRYLEATLGRPVVMSSAPDFPSFVKRTQQGEYDLVVTAPHMARLAQKRDGWQAVAMSAQQTATTIIVQKDSTIGRLEDLRGKRLAVGSRYSVTYLLAEEALGKRGLKLGRDVLVQETASFSNVLQSVLVGEVEAGATPTLLWDNWVHANAEQRAKLREIYRAPPPNPHSFFVMMPPATPAAAVAKLREALLAWNETPEGRDFLHKSQFLSFVAPTEKAMARSDPFVHVLIEDK